MSQERVVGGEDLEHQDSQRTTTCGVVEDIVIDAECQVACRWL